MVAATPVKTSRKEFLVIAHTVNCNSFGLRGFVLAAEDGEGWAVMRSDYGSHGRWQMDEFVQVPMLDGTPCWAHLSCECPEKLPACPDLSAVQRMFKKARSKA